MARIDPHTIGLSMNGRTASGIADLGARVAMLERGGGGIPGGGSGLVGAVSDLGTGSGAPIDLDVTSATLTASLPITATPRIQSLGVNVTAPATAGDVQATRLGAGVAPDFPLRVEGASNVAFFRGTGVDTNLLLDTDTASKQARLYFRDLATTKWSLGKQTDASFTLFNHTTARYDLIVDNATGLITIGRDLDAAGVSTPQVILNNYILSTTGGINTGRGGDSITSDIAASSGDSAFYNEVNHLVHNTSGSANTVVGRCYINPHEDVADKYGEGFGGIFYSHCSRRGALAAPIEAGVSIYNPADTGVPAPQVIHGTHTGPARAAGVAVVLNERNPYSDYNSATIFGSVSPWTVSGSRGYSALSVGQCRGGTGIYIGGYHANNFTETGGAPSPPDTREWQNALVVNVGADFTPQQLGTDVFLIDGLGRTTTQVGAAHVIRSYSAYADANPRWRINYDGKIEWGEGGSTSITDAATGVSLFKVATVGTKSLRTNADWFVIDDGGIDMGFPMDAASSATPVIGLQNLATSTTGGINTRGTAGDDITKDVACGATDSSWYSQVNQITHADRGSANSVTGTVYLNPFSGADVYAEGFGGLFASLVARRGALAGGIECGVTVFHPTNDTSFDSMVIDTTYTGPARATVGSFILEEHNAYSAYTGGGSIFGTTSAWTSTGSRGISVQSNGPFRGGTGIYITGYHAANYTVGGGTPGTPDTREWERALVVSVGADFSPQATGLEPFILRGNGQIQWNLDTAGNVIEIYKLAADTQPKFRVTHAGEIRWGVGTSTATDTNLFRDAADLLRTNDSFRVDGNLNVIGTTSALTSTGQVSGVILNVTGVTGNGVDGFLSFVEVATTQTAPAANGARVFAEDDGSANTGLYVRFLNNKRMIRKDVAAQTYTVTNHTTDRSFDQDTVALPELADVVGTLITDLRTEGLVA